MTRLKYALVLLVGLMLVRTSPLKANDQCSDICGPSVPCETECPSYGNCLAYAHSSQSMEWCDSCGDDYCDEVIENIFTCPEDCGGPSCEWGNWQFDELYGRQVETSLCWDEGLNQYVGCYVVAAVQGVYRTGNCGTEWACDLYYCGEGQGYDYPWEAEAACGSEFGDWNCPYEDWM
jgi:hypothetical protein